MTFIEKQEKFFKDMQAFFGGSIVLGIHGVCKDTNRQYVVTPAKRNNEPADQWNRPAVIEDLRICRDANSRGQDVFVRPTTEKEPYFILIDDIPDQYINAEYNQSGRLLVASSSTGRQMWLRCNRPLNREEKIYVSENFYAGCDSSAARAPGQRNGRMAGFFNKKPKYNPNYPVANIIWVTEGIYEVPFISEEDQAPLRKKADIAPPIKISADYVFKANLPRRSDYLTDNESVTDFRFCLALARRKVTRDEIATMLHSERTNWESKGLDYIDRYIIKTVDKAINLVNL